MTATRKQKIFGVGLSRTGTTSLHRALEILGYRSVHWIGDYRRLYRFEAATDTNITFAYHALDLMHPGSKFILTLRRDLSAWIESMFFMHHHLVEMRTSFDGPMALRKIFKALYFRVDGWTVAQLTGAYNRHTDRVRHYFEERPGDLLELDITEGDGWEKL